MPRRDRYSPNCGEIIGCSRRAKQSAAACVSLLRGCNGDVVVVAESRNDDDDKRNWGFVNAICGIILWEADRLIPPDSVKVEE